MARGDRPTTIAKGAYGRPSSFGRDTSGFKGWMPVYFNVGKNPDGSPKIREGYKNVLNNQEFTPAAGHNADPPYATGEIMSHHTSDLYRQNYDQIRWDKPQEAANAER